MIIGDVIIDGEKKETANWTRYLNHAADPNLRVKSLPYAYVNKGPRVWFVANREIQAGDDAYNQIEGDARHLLIPGASTTDLWRRGSGTELFSRERSPELGATPGVPPGPMSAPRCGARRSATAPSSPLSSPEVRAFPPPV